MAEWYEIDQEKRTDTQKLAAQFAYYNTLLKGKEGRQLFADLRRRLEFIKKAAIDEEKFAFAAIVLDRFLSETRQMCGPVDMVDQLTTESINAGSYLPKTPEQSAPDGIDPEEYNKA